MSRKNQTNGFSAVGVIVIVAALAAVGLVGWFVWHKNKNDGLANRTNANSTSQSDKTNTNTNQNTVQADPSEGGKYLVITEWGVRIPLPESLRGDITYGIQTKSADQDEVASFEIGKLAKLPNSNCKLHTESDGSGKSGGIGIMLFRKAANLVPPEGLGTADYTSSDGQYKYYGARRMYGLCASTGYEQIQLDNADALATALKEVQQTPSN